MKKWTPPKKAEFVQQQSPACAHEHTAPVRFRQSNGVIVVRMQCTACKYLCGAVPKSRFNDIDSFPLLDGDYLNRWWKDRGNAFYEHERRRRQQHESEQSKQWWQWYNAYLQSPEWKHRRGKVINRAGGLCEACRERSAVHVHHLTYAHVGREPLFDLVAICQQCHDDLHDNQG